MIEDNAVVQAIDTYRATSKEWDASFRALCPRLTAQGVALLNRRLLQAALATEGNIPDIKAWMRKEIPLAMAPVV